MANEIIYYPPSGSSMYYDWIGKFDGYNEFAVGYDNAEGTAVKGALRFTNVNIDRNTFVNEATLMMQAGYRAGNGDIKVKVWGIDEGNTADFTSYPMGRPKTDASNTHQWSGSQGEYFPVGVTGLVNEILARGDWNANNAMGFIVEDNGTSTSADNYLTDGYSAGSLSYLMIRVSAEPNFTPTPITVSAPSLPIPKDYGLKIAKPGVNVLTASEENLFFSTRKLQFKVITQQQVTTSANPHVITHSLGYKPFAEAFAKSGSVWVRCPYLGLDSNYATPYIEITSTELKIHIAIGTVVYYYIFLDQLGT